MTGFGSASGEHGGYALRVEIRSVNHRHLQVKARLPAEFAFVEGDLERVVRQRLERGSLTVHLYAARVASTTPALLDVELVRRYKEQLDRIAAATGLEGVVRLEALIALPGVVRVVEAEGGGAEGAGKGVLQLVSTALDRLLEMRRSEGRVLALDLQSQSDAIEKLVGRIAKRMPAVTRGHQRTLHRRVKELVARREGMAEAELAREIALLADRLDVSEELARLGSHLSQLDALLAKGGIVGRKLEFLIQELFREINTIGSKCNDAQVAHWVVDAKTHAERLREQVQNVE